jgi:murein L,D-transpeptidase YafK
MPQSVAQHDAQAAANSNREFTQAPEESLTAEQRAGRLLLAKQQAEAAAELSQARVEQLEQVLLPAEDELKSLAKVEVSYMVERWREAWSSGDLKTYLLSYSPNFKPANDLSFDQWRAKRMYRVTPEKNITIELDDFEVVMLEQLSSAVVEFNQHYQSGSYAETSRKQLRLSKEQGGWKIMAEIELP